MDNPSQELFNFADITYSMIKNTKTRCKNKRYNNLAHKNSIWRFVESSLIGTSDPNVRQFLYNFEKCIPLQNAEKYYDTSVNMIRIFMMDLASKSQLNNNHTQPSSSWGLLSTNIYTTNTLDDRRFLSQLWAIGNEVDKIEGESLDVLLHKTVRIRNKRKEKQIYDQNRYQHNLTISPPPQPIEDNLIVPSQTTQVALIELLDKLYKKSIQQYATQPCDNCMLLMYQSQARNISITPQPITLFSEIDVQYQRPSQMKVCQRCKNNLQKFKIPPKSKINGMALLPIPKELECLSMAEIRLISQVKPHMKVFHTCRGQGQRAMKGLVVHFPQQVK
ncbi:hypothetical protein Fcan01_14393 [Folsomia candida]|uniref:DUF6570 domain-containing protein n=1 Tax=Folsomia candida TaxID=158441 RepID=A0A226E065_FOLCA|nr:hypothetical protein Fcan01_14393 [Folsomia candida]